MIVVMCLYVMVINLWCWWIYDAHLYGRRYFHIELVNWFLVIPQQVLTNHIISTKKRHSQGVVLASWLCHYSGSTLVPQTWRSWHTLTHGNALGAWQVLSKLILWWDPCHQEVDFKEYFDIVIDIKTLLHQWDSVVVGLSDG